MKEVATPIPNLSQSCKKTAFFRIVKHQEKYIPQERMFRIFWTKLARLHSSANTPHGFTTFDEAAELIKDEVESRERYTRYRTEEIKAYYSKSGSLYV